MPATTDNTAQIPAPGRPADYPAADIVAAGKRLQAAGRSVTAFALRREVGGGNANRLKQIWDEYQASQITTRQDTAAELPIEVAEAVTAVSNALVEQIAALAIELNTKAVRSAERRTAEVVRAAGEQRDQAERELIDAAETVDDIESKLNAEIEESAALRSSLAEIRDENQKRAIEIAQLRERNATAERELNKTTSELEALRKKLATAEAAQKEAGSRADALHAALQTAETRATERETRANNLNAELERLHASLTSEKEARAGEQIRANEIADELKTVRQQAADQAAHQAEQFAELRAHNQSLQQTVDTEKAARTAEQMRANEIADELKTVRERAAHQADQFAELRAHNQGLQQTLERHRAELQTAETERDAAKQQAANQAGELTALRQIAASLQLAAPVAESTMDKSKSAKNNRKDKL